MSHWKDMPVGGAIVIIVIVIAGSPVVKAKLTALWNRLRSGGTAGIKEVG